MTKRQKKLFENLKSKKHKTVSSASKDAGYKNTQTNLAERAVRSALGNYLRALESAGVTDLKSATVIFDAMEAKNNRGKPDHYARLKANEQLLKVKNLIGSDAPELQNHRHFTIIFPPGVKPDGYDGKGNGTEAVSPKKVSS